MRYNAAGMIVAEHKGGGIRHDGGFENFATMNEQGVQRAGADDFKPDGFAAGGQMHDDEIFHVGPVNQAVTQPGLEEIHNASGIIEHMAGELVGRVVETHDLELGAAQFGSPGGFHFWKKRCRQFGRSGAGPPRLITVIGAAADGCSGGTIGRLAGISAGGSELGWWPSASTLNFSAGSRVLKRKPGMAPSRR